MESYCHNNIIVLAPIAILCTSSKFDCKLVFVDSSSASPADISTTSPVEITFEAGDGDMDSPTTRCNSDIDIVDDPDQEGDEEFEIFISDPVDCLDISFAQVIILDNDNGVLPILV